MAPRGYLTFQGTGWSKKHPVHQIDVLCGDNPPTITDGYANWSVIDRPLMRGISIFTGYNPTVMTCEVRFGNWTRGGWDQSGRNPKGDRTIEDDIYWLGWMAGEAFADGQSPVVYVDAYAFPSGLSNLIPKQWRNKTWVVSGLSWGLSYRNQHGNRIWQDAQVTLMQFLSVGQNAPKQTRKVNGGWFIATARRNTALLIASAPSGRSPLNYNETLARRIVSDPRNHRLYPRVTNSSIRQKIKVGRRVWVPGHVA